ncbi:hypothetical protein niasHS_011492 [Heterodera schachtii]|uniref:Uncharacterized protein n=1 Tax=Heterodera schachtii TaxID=97005 RepID=A0ABD2IHM7_HETSC
MLWTIIFGLLFLTIELESVDRDKNRRDRVEPGPSEQTLPQNDIENMPFDDFVDDLFTLPQKHVENMSFDVFVDDLFQTNYAHAKPQIPIKPSAGKQRNDHPTTSRFNTVPNRAKQTQTRRIDQPTTHQTDQSMIRGKGIEIGRQISDHPTTSRFNTVPNRAKQTPQTRRIDQPTTHQTDHSMIRGKGIEIGRQISDQSTTSRINIEAKRTKQTQTRKTDQPTTHQTDQSMLRGKDIAIGGRQFSDQPTTSRINTEPNQTNRAKQTQTRPTDQLTTHRTDQSMIRGKGIEIGRQFSDQPTTSRINTEPKQTKQTQITQTRPTDQLTTHRTDQSMIRGKGIVMGGQVSDRSMASDQSIISVKDSKQTERQIFEKPTSSRNNTEPKRNKQTQTRRIDQPTRTDQPLFRAKGIVMERQFSDRSMASDQSTITTKGIVIGKQTSDQSMISTNERKRMEREISDQSTISTKGSDQSTISEIKPHPMMDNRKLKEKQTDPVQSLNISRSKTEPMGQKQTKRQLNDQPKFTRTKSDLLGNDKQTEKQMSRSNSEPAKRAYPKIKIIFQKSKYKELSKVIENEQPQSAREEPKTDEEKRQIVHQFIELKKKYLHLTDENCDLPFIEMEEKIAGEIGFQRSIILSWKKEFDKNKKQKKMPIDAAVPPFMEEPAATAAAEEEDEVLSAESSADESAPSLYEEEESENDSDQDFSSNKKRRSIDGGGRHHPLKNWKQLINEYYSIKNAQNITDAKIAEQLGINRVTLYKYKKKHEAECVAQKQLTPFQNEDNVSKMEKLSTAITGKAPMMDKRSAKKVKNGGGTSVAKKLKIGTSAGSSSKAQKIDEKQQQHDKGTKSISNLF